MNFSRLPLLRLGAAVSLFTIAGCSTPHATVADKPAAPAKPSPPSKPSALCSIHDLDGPAIPSTFTGTLGTTHKTRAANHVVQINSIQTACCGTFDRVVIDFDGLRLPPDYTIQYVTGPVSQCGSGLNVPLAGHAILKISFKTTQAHTDAGQPTVTNRNVKLDCPNLRQMALTCDFESHVEIDLGLQSKKPYRAVELLNDSKLVIDIKH